MENKIGNAIFKNAIKLSKDLSAKYIIALTEYGYAARGLKEHLKKNTFLVFTPNKKLLSTHTDILTDTHIMEKAKTADEACLLIKKQLTKSKMIEKGDLLVVVTGAPFKKAEESNTIIILKV